MAFASLLANKLRTALTMLGLIIGVGAVITLVSIGQGTQAAVTQQFSSLGTNLVFVTPGTTSSGGVRIQAGSVNTLTYDDAQAIADPSNVPAALEVSPEVQAGGQMVYLSRNTFGQIVGVTATYADVHNYGVSQGAWISDDQVQAAANDIVLGATLTQTLFGDASPIGQSVRINAGGGAGGSRSAYFQVIGVGESKGGSGFNNPDTEAYIPITSAMQKLSRPQSGTGAQTVSNVTVKALDATSVKDVQQEVTELLMQRHHIADPTALDFSVISQADQMQALTQATSILTLFLGAVAGIALLVGGIGIMNIMIVSVTERTHEIGLRKAVGATRADILAQFLVESLILSVAGGATGVLVGVALSWMLNGAQLNGRGLQTVVTLPSIILAAGVSIAVGVIFGIYPAERAAHLTPIDALHYE